MLFILKCGFMSVALTFVLWSIWSWKCTHAILKNPFKDGYCSLADMLGIALVVGILIGVMK